MNMRKSLVIVALLLFIIRVEGGFGILQPIGTVAATATLGLSNHRHHHHHRRRPSQVVLDITATTYSSKKADFTPTTRRRTLFSGTAALFSACLLTTTTTTTTPSWILIASAATLEPPAMAAVRDLVFSKSDSTTNNNGGILFQLQDYLEQRDYAALRQNTAQYDLILRKQAMGRAQQALLAAVADDDDDDRNSKVLSQQAQALRNAVTFDLIGINRASRPGQENATEVARYMDELKNDVVAFMALWPKNKVK
jgi:hypothetical protein